MVDKRRLVFVHLSDIHFGSSRGVWDLDSELRNEVERDVAPLCDPLGPTTGLLVSGDVAFAGAPAEYDRAIDWLKKLGDLLKCPDEDVWVVPGNHDIDRGVTGSSSLLRMCHQRLRNCAVAEIDEVLYEYLVGDATAREIMFRPMDAYNQFATKYGCSISAGKPYWEEDFEIGGGYTLRMRGLTSPIISDSEDDDGAHKLVLGTAQSMLLRRQGLVYMTMCHHPPAWLRDGDAVSDALIAASHLQLWGHRHVHRARVVDRTLQISAGAVHPERSAVHWEPRYNVFTVALGEEAKPTLEIDVYPRVWQSVNRKFGPDTEIAENGHRLYRLAIEPETAPSGDHARAPLPVNLDADRYEPAPRVEENAARVVNRTRRLAFRYSSLPFQVRLEVARTLGLIEAEDRESSDSELFEHVLSRAVQQGKLAQLWDEVERRHPKPSEISNPFRERLNEHG